MSHAKDRDLIRRTLAGEQKAFDLLYRAYRPYVHAIILRRTGDRNEADDLMQTTFMRAFLALKSFRGEAAFSTWLTQIALNVCASHLRAQQARRVWLCDEEDVRPLPCEGPEEAMRRMRRQEIVMKGIRTLPHRYREVMWLRHVQDRSYTEITSLLRVPLGTVKTWLCRARRQLKGEFQKAGLRTA